MRTARVVIAIGSAGVMLGVLRYCARQDACYDASGVWDRRSGTCQAPWCAEAGGRWVDGMNYCIPRECLDRGLDWDPHTKQCAKTSGTAG